tara:strand:- start:1367 stop:2539 length:1173 start_codon:yes stop_codon:yes gene_type:complete
MKKNNLLKVFSFGLALFMASCSSDTDPTPTPVGCTVSQTLTSYAFTNDSLESTVAYGGQTLRMQQANAIYDVLNFNLAANNVDLLTMWQNGQGFTNTDLNSTTKNIEGKLAYGSFTNGMINAAERDAVQNDFVAWILDFETSDIANASDPADTNQAGMLGGYELNAKGMEIDQIIAKSLSGALIYDNIANHYSLPVQLNAQNNTDRYVGTSPKPYTSREHYWDEAVGYIYGLDNVESPAYGADLFLNKYLGGNSVATWQITSRDKIYNACIHGREAVVANCPAETERQAVIIRNELKKLIAQKAFHYFDQCGYNPDGVPELDQGNPKWFHYLAEGYGFLYSLQFTDYMNRDQVMGHLNSLTDGNGFWDVTAADCQAIADEISAITGEVRQ